MAPSIKSLVWATDIDVLGLDSIVERRDGYWAVRSPSNPTFWWGNFLLLDDAPGPGDGGRWEELFAEEFPQPDMTHRCFAWDRVDGSVGAAEQELVTRGFELERTSGLIARPGQLVPHARANADVAVVALDPVPDADEELWEQVIQLQQSQAPPVDDLAYHLTFLRRRQEELRAVFSAGRGAWYAAVLDGRVVASLGIVVTGTRARYQSVDTATEFRRRGIATRLVADAAIHALSRHAIDHFVIAADPDYHAIGIYEALGFERVELVVGAMRKPDGA